MENELTSELASKGYWPAVALEYLNRKKYSRAVELCTMRLKDEPDILSGRLILGQAYFYTGQYEEAEDEMHRVLGKDPENMVALKILGDITFQRGDEAIALSYYSRVLQIDPRTHGLKSAIDENKQEKTRILKIHRGGEVAEEKEERLRSIPFKTETAGELLLAQGHTRLALKVFEELAETNASPRLLEKVEQIRAGIKNKEK